MKKFFTSFKSVVAAVVMASMTLAASCSYDDTGVKNELEQIKQDLTALTERVAALEKRLGEEVAALTELINGKVVVTSVEKVGEATTVTLSDGTSFTVYPECGVVDTDTDTNTYISIAEEGGVLYFAVYEKGEFKEWLLINGEKVPVYDGNDQDDNVCDDPYTAVAPQFQVNTETGEIEVSIDGGQTWVSSGLSASATGAQLFTGVKVNDNNTVTFTLVDGTSFDVVIAELIEFNTTRGQLYVKAGETKEISVTINDAVADVNVMNQPLGWKAEIALAENNEEGDDNLDDNMGVLAVGGTEFVLKVTGPSQDFINAGYAEEKGYITVHFNSDNGSCKVGKVAVELASIVLDVTKEGMVTVTSTWVDEYLYSSWAGDEWIQEFNNYYVCIMPLEYYVEDLASIWNASWWEFNVPCVGGWINNFFYNVNEEFNTTDKATYAVGENEKWTFQASVEDIIGVLDWGGTMTYEGNSFAVIIVPTDPQSYGSLLIDQALVDTFKQVNVNVEVTETAWNEAYLNATLRGGNAYHFNIENKDELNRMIENGWYADIETYYNDYIYYWQNYNSQFGGYTLTQDVVAENISFNDLINYGEEYPYLYELAPNSTYIVAILVEEDEKTDYSYEDLIIFEFTTEDLVAATEPFEYTIVRNDEDCTYFNIFADVTVSENVVGVYSAWLNEEMLEPAELKDYLVKNGWLKNDFSMGYTYTLNTTVNNAGDEKYLSLLLVDAEGNYQVASQLIASKEVVVNEEVEVTIENVVFNSDMYAGKVADITLGGLEGVEFTQIQAYVCATNGYSYYLRSEEQLQDIAYGTDWMYKKYYENPFTVVQTADYTSYAIKDSTYIIAVGVQFADGTVSAPIYKEVAFSDSEEEPAGDLVFTSAKYAGDVYGSKQLTFTTADGFAVNFGLKSDNNYLEEKFYNYEYASDFSDDGRGYISMNGSSWEGFDLSWAIFTMDVKIVDGVYNITLNATHDAQVATGTYVGDIEGFDYPSTGGNNDGPTQETDGIFVSAVATIDGSWCNVTFTDAYGNHLDTSFGNGGVNYLNATTWDFEDWYSDGTAIGNTYYNDNGEQDSANWVSSIVAVVTHVDGKYNIEFTTSIGNFTFNGDIEGLIVPEAEEGGEEEGGETGDLEIFQLTGATGGNWADLIFHYYDETLAKNTGVQISFNFGASNGVLAAGSWSLLNGGLYESYTYWGYGLATADQEHFSDLTVDITVSEDGTNNTFVVKGTTLKGRSVSFTYTGHI